MSEGALLALGLAGQGLFGARMLLQWLASERAGRSVAPRAFWGLSLLASACVGSYAALSGNWVFLLTVLPGAFVYARMLAIERPASGTALLMLAAPLAVLAVAAALREPLTGPLPVTMVGFAGWVLWTSRFPIQWWISERDGTPALGAAFWIVSLAGAACLLSYAAWHRDGVMALAFGPGIFIHARNLVLIRRAGRAATPPPRVAVPDRGARLSARRLRVLLVVHQFFPHSYLGTERYALELARGLGKLGHDVSVLSMAPHTRPDEPGTALFSYTYDGVRVIALNGFLRAPASFEETFARSDLGGLWREVLAEVQPDVVHACHLLQHTPEFLRVVHETGVPLVATLTDFWGICWGSQLTTGRTQRPCAGPDRLAWNCVADMLDTREAPTRWLPLNAVLRSLRDTPLHAPVANALRLLPRGARRRLVPELDAVARRPGRLRERYRLADSWIAPSQYLLDRYVQAGFAPERFHRIPYGIEPPEPAEGEALAARFAAERPLGARVRFGYLGQIAPHKGVHELVRAFRAAALRDASLAIHGDADAQPAYTAKLRRLADDDPRIRFEGPYPSRDVYRVLASFDVLVVPSLWHENAPLVLLTALESGTPVVVPRAHGMIEFVRPDFDGLVYEMNDTEGLQRCIEELACNPAKLHRIGTRRSRYGFRGVDMARATLDLYAEARAAGRPVRFDPPEDRIDPVLRRLDEGEEIPTCDAAEIVGVLATTGARGIEAWVPRERPLPAAVLRLRQHSKPHVSLWSRGDEAIELDRHPDFASADSLEIVGRHNRGSASLLRYAFNDGAGRERIGELRFSWPKENWGRLSVPLSTRGGCPLTRLQWIPSLAGAPTPLKVNVLEVRFRGGRRGPVSERAATSGA